jgi:hypothetical protein
MERVEKHQNIHTGNAGRFHVSMDRSTSKKEKIRGWAKRMEGRKEGGREGRSEERRKEGKYPPKRLMN